MTINKKISLLALGLITLPSCHVTEEPTGGKPTDEETSGADAGANSQEPDDETERPSPDADGGVDTDVSAPDEPTADAGANTEEPADDTSEPSAPPDEADGGIHTGDETEQPPPDAQEPETSSFFMPTVEPDNTVSPRIRVDANGGVHAVYAAYAGGGAYYAYCESGCDDYDNFDVIYFPTEGTVANAMIALTKDGKPRVLLSEYMGATYATCDNDCTDIDNWETGVVLEHDSDQEITGEALALDKQGNPHFLAHTYRAYFGIGQKDPYTYHLACTTAPCTDKGNWTNSQIATQIWEENNLLFDDDGNAHLGFVALVMEDKVVEERFSAYATCSGECTNEADWVAVGVAKAYTDHLEAINLTSGISLALTKDGHPRLLTLAKADDDTKQLIYFECDKDCGEGNFTGSILSTNDDINVGVDLTLDAQDHPRFVYTLNYNIFLASCDDEPCSAAESEWKLHTVEAGSEMPPDDIILYPNCSVAAWFLHSPVVDLDLEGNPLVGYQARDISGGVHNADPTKPDCVAGTDMTLTRMTKMVWE